MKITFTGRDKELTMIYGPGTDERHINQIYLPFLLTILSTLSLSWSHTALCSRSLSPSAVPPLGRSSGTGPENEEGGAVIIIHDDDEEEDAVAVGEDVDLDGDSDRLSVRSIGIERSRVRVGRPRRSRGFQRGEDGDGTRGRIKEDVGVVRLHKITISRIKRLGNGK